MKWFETHNTCPVCRYNIVTQQEQNNTTMDASLNNNDSTSEYPIYRISYRLFYE